MKDENEVSEGQESLPSAFELRKKLHCEVAPNLANSPRIDSLSKMPARGEERAIAADMMNAP